MDTKWKKWKPTGSFLCFFLGVTLLLYHAVPLITLWRIGSQAVKNADYQEQAQFRDYIAERLEELLGVATGGKGWQIYGTADRVAYRNFYETGDMSEYSCEYSEELLDRWLGSGTGTVVEQAEAETIPSDLASDELCQEPWWGNDYETYDAYNEYDVYDQYDAYWNRPRTRQEYMTEMAQNKNLRYAVVYQKKLVYTNIDGYEEKAGKDWEGGDFYQALDPEEYNFFLWFNRDGDGKVQITKDGTAEEIYGNGVYTTSSRWFVPGYTNFNVDQSTDEAVIFLAAAREPRLYINGNYSAYGTNQYGNRLYEMQQRIYALGREFKMRCALVGAALLLLVLSFFQRRDKRRADQAIAGGLGKIWLELKLFLLVLLAISFLFHGGPAAWFWLLYLLALDVRYNRGRQKKPLFDSIRTRDLRRPVQKRMVRRYYMALAVLLAAFVTTLLFLLLLLIAVWYERTWGPIGIIIVTTFAVVVILAICAIAGFLSMRNNRRLAEDIGALSDQIAAVRAGNLRKPLAMPRDGDLAQAAENLNQIQRGLEEALREQMQSERMKVELVTNVSHDIKTPLTAIISYAELLKQEEELPEHVQEFIRILWEKSQRLKTIVQDVFEVSKAAAGQLLVKPEELDLGRLLRQVLADMDDQIRDSGLIMRTSVSENPLFIRADGQRLYRVFQNLLQNALKYSLLGSRVYLAMKAEGNRASVYLKNTSGTELDTGIDFSERFVRGDASRTDGGSGLGLSIAKSFTEACGGSFRVETDADLFTVVVVFPILDAEK